MNIYDRPDQVSVLYEGDGSEDSIRAVLAHLLPVGGRLTITRLLADRDSGLTYAQGLFVVANQDKKE